MTQLTEVIGKNTCKTRIRINACADRCAALRQGFDGGKRMADALRGVVDLAFPSTQFLCESHGHRIHQMGAASFDHISQL
ncbi:Uncharacterised protein [Vibrio cholerae]|nr:Uncharacterised protein [Vibrio cholerae]CSA63114.1 Uncharacterised protein [Vibrio cholerae]CSB14792.1 Uncharacterised protein [Vibrio cholerae]CSB35356.1 Uncharacterised protein [Vibrio cholerae]CSB59174.1 Uncharacterised protein [Vibrio cholerae]